MGLVNKILNEVKLNEIGDLKNFSFKFTGPRSYKDDGFEYTYKIPGTLKFVTLIFSYLPNIPQEFSEIGDTSKVYNVGYSVNGSDGQGSKTNLKELNNILSTNFQIIKDFINKENPTMLLIQGNKKDGLVEPDKMSIKHRLYGEILKKEYYIYFRI